MYNKLNLDGSVETKFHGSLVYALNKVLDETGREIVNEDGFELLFDATTQIQHIETTNKHIIVFGRTGLKFTIGLYTIATDTYEIIISTTYIRITPTNKIDCAYFYNYLDELTIHIINGVDTTSTDIMVLNLHNLPFTLTANKELINAEDIKLIFSAPNVKPCNIDFKEITKGGSLNTGSYIVYIAYKLINDNETEIINSSKPVYIYYSDEPNSNTEIMSSVQYVSITGSDSGLTTNKGFSLTVSNIDNTAKALYVYVLYSNSNVKSVFKKEISISSTTTDIHIDNLFSFAQISIDEILIPKPLYTKGNAIATISNKLIIGTVKTDEQIAYQKFANNISVKWKRVDSATCITNIDFDNNYLQPYGSNTSVKYNKSYKNNKFTYNFKTFQPFEVVALYIRLFNAKGVILGDFHIPGRQAFGDNNSKFDTTTGTGKININDYPIHKDDYSLGADVYKYQTRDTCTADTSSKLSGHTGYWENKNEFYPQDENYDIFNVDTFGNPVKIGSLQGANVRHHRIPSQNTLRVTDADKYLDEHPVIQLECSNIKFPNEFKTIISHYQILYAVRDGNNNVIQDESLLHHTIPKTSINEISAYHRDYYSNEESKTIFVTKPFNVIANNDIPKVNYIHVNYLVEDVIDIDASVHDVLIDGSIDNHYKFAYSFNRNFRFYNHPNKVKYISPTNANILRPVIETQVIPQGAITMNINNSYGDILVGIKIANMNVEFNDYDCTPNSGATNQNPINSGYFKHVTLCTYKTDCYYPFTDQSTAIGTDIIPINTSTAVVSGDSFVGLHSYRICNRWLNSPYVGQTFRRLYATPVYSRSNIELRHSNTFPFSPNFNDLTLGFGEYCELDTSVYNPINLNLDFANINKYRSGIIFNINNKFISYHKRRVIISNSNLNESLVNNWNTFELNAYRELEIHSEQIEKLSASLTILYIQCLNTLYLMQFNDELQVNTGEIGLQERTIFNARIDELYSATKNGNIGTTERYNSVLTPYGLILVDSDKQEVYLATGNKITILTPGIQSLFETYEQQLNNSLHNSYLKYGLVVGYNDKESIVIISFSDNGYQPETDEYDVSYPLPLANRFTVTYNLKYQAWVSFHSYFPYQISSNRLDTFSVKYNEVYKHNNKSVKCTYYKTMQKYDNERRFIQHDDIADYIFNAFLNKDGLYAAQTVVKRLTSFILQSTIYINGIFNYDKQCDYLAVYNDTQCSNNITNLYKRNYFNDTGFRIVNNIAYFNKFVDKIKNNMLAFIDKDFKFINSNFKQGNYFNLSKFISTFTILRIGHTNTKAVKETYIITNVDINHARINVDTNHTHINQ